MVSQHARRYIGRHEMTQQAGVAYLGSAGTAHDVVALAPAVFVEIELKR